MTVKKRCPLLVETRITRKTMLTISANCLRSGQSSRTIPQTRTAVSHRQNNAKTSQ